MNREQLTKIVSLYQEDIKDLHVDYDRNSTTITVCDRNITAVFTGDELDDGLVHEVLNHVIGIDNDDREGKVSLGYDYNYNFAGHRRKAISDEMLHDIVRMHQHGFSDRDIADKIGISIESVVHQIRMARSRRHKLYKKFGGRPY